MTIRQVNDITLYIKDTSLVVRYRDQWILFHSYNSPARNFINRIKHLEDNRIDIISIYSQASRHGVVGESCTSFAVRDIKKAKKVQDPTTGLYKFIWPEIPTLETN